MPSNQHQRFEVITQEDTSTGDLILPIPPILLKQMGWSQGDDIELVVGTDGNLYLKRANK